MDLIEALYSRRSIRRFRPADVPGVLLKEVLAAAVQAPSALNQQPWAFAVFQGRRNLAVIERRLRRDLLSAYPTTSELPPKATLLSQECPDLLHGANALIVIYATNGRLQPTEDCCLAAQNLMLAAHALGLGTCPVGFARHWFDLPETKLEMGIDLAHTAVFPVVLGYPDEPPNQPSRKEPRLLAWELEV